MVRDDTACKPVVSTQIRRSGRIWRCPVQQFAGAPGGIPAFRRADL